LTYLVIRSDICICLSRVVDTENILVIKSDHLYSFGSGRGHGNQLKRPE
jgi:hypothetical protein